ncbi:MAG: adenylyltransferase/cytidyltransferase family protein [Rickettsiales bacterium]|jgi:glycerol-3-phosphate cytidylyltransferase|nr:adenylyltransferase/cytidyltransferase family protein [Rickettsiales bacterium]
MIVGFASGTFDMFHVGHLNLFKRAKEYCDKLVVGVNTDELVYSYKNHYPIIPVEQRIEIIKCCKYVDEVKKKGSRDSIEFYKDFKFDILFIGDDYINSEQYVKLNEQLREYGSKVMFLSYTKGISSTEIRKKCSESLNDVK